MRISLAIGLVKDDLPYNLSGPQVPGKGSTRTVVSLINVNFISGHQTCHWIGDVLSCSSFRTSPKVMTIPKINGLTYTASDQDERFRKNSDQFDERCGRSCGDMV